MKRTLPKQMAFGEQKPGMREVALTAARQYHNRAYGGERISFAASRSRIRSAPNTGKLMAPTWRDDQRLPAGRRRRRPIAKDGEDGEGNGARYG